MSVLLLNKMASPPSTPAADKIGIFIDSTEVLAYIIDTGVTRNLPAWVQPTTFTPGISFGGGVTGITYSAQVGRYERIGARVFFSAFVVLSSKGSSTGVALVTGLPLAALNTANYYQAVSVRYDVMTSISGAAMGFILPGTSTVRLEHLGTGTAAQLLDTNFTNTSSVIVSGIYEQ